LLGEGTDEWFQKFDPCGTEKISEIYGTPIPAAVVERQAELEVWRRIMETRAIFETEFMQPEIGGEYIRTLIVNEWQSYKKNAVEQRRLRNIKLNTADLVEVIRELEQEDYLKLPVLEFEKVTQPTPLEMQVKYVKYHQYDP
jgi:hypothetical protein